LLISAYAALGDQKLRNADTAGGVEMLFLAIDQAPASISDKLFSGVISQIPLNLYLSGERNLALKAARNIEAKFGNDVNHLLAIAGFYLGVENGDEAVRVAGQAVKMAPDMAEAHHALALGLHISLRLDEAMAEYKKAFDLDPKTKGVRRSLADLNRASGKSQDAITLYREQLVAEPTDKAARTGLVLALLDAGMKDEANTELESALRDDPKNIGLLTGAGYWFTAHGDSDRGFDLARRAVETEPRYTWGQIAAARALVAKRQPLEAERSLRYARQYGKFPTLDYELASALAAAGLYEEASEALQPAFVLKDEAIETRLGGRLLARESGFIELLAPERRASIFQFTAADTEENAAMLKALLAFSRVLSEEPANETAIVAAAKQFANGQDNGRAYRQLYAASRLLRKNVGLATAYDLAQTSTEGIDAALEVPAVTVAVQADELRDIRARAIASGGTPDIAEAPRSALRSILLGRVEDLSGWALFNQDKASEAIQHLQSATKILPEGTPSWRTALWHLGAALEQTDQKTEALNAYIKSYVSGDPDPLRRKLIEQLYTKVNGSLDGLDQRLNGPATATPVSTPATDTAVAAATPAPPPPQTQQTPAPTPSPETVAASATEKKAEQPLTTPKDTPPAPTLTEEEALARAASRVRSTVKIHGRVKDSNNNGVANVVVVLISPRGTVLATTTDGEGKYSFSVSPSQRNYRLLPSKEGMMFDPVDKSIVAYLEDLKDVDFIASTRSP
jgi:Flp pilus assembly protein TadD